MGVNKGDKQNEMHIERRGKKNNTFSHTLDNCSLELLPSFSFPGEDVSTFGAAEKTGKHTIGVRKTIHIHTNTAIEISVLAFGLGEITQLSDKDKERWGAIEEVIVRGRYRGVRLMKRIECLRK